MKYFSALESKEDLTYATTWMNLEDIMLSEISQSQKDKDCIILFFFFFRATSAAYGGSQASSWIGAVAAGIHHSHSNSRSEPSLWPTPQLMAMLDS